jgi:4-oxalocrotonate tautomerase
MSKRPISPRCSSAWANCSLYGESYAHIDEVKGDAYGFGGFTQERRYVAGQLEVAPRKAAA